MAALTELPWQPIYDELGVAVPPLDDRPLGYFIEEHAANRPDAVALQYLDREISYRELNELANRCANSLLSLDVGRGDVVGIHLPNVPQYVVALVACCKIGCAGSGVSPLLSPGEVAYQIADAGIGVLLSLDNLAVSVLTRIEEQPACLRHVIVTSAADHLAPSLGVDCDISGVQVHRYLDLLESASPRYFQRDTDPHDTMMVQYTGGTTGSPKGAELTIRNLMYNGLQTSACAPWTTYGEFVATAFPLFHAAGLAFVLISLRSGGRFFLIPDPRDVAHFCRQMQRYPPTRLAAVTSLYQLLLACPEIADVDFSQLRTATCGAAPLAAQERRKIESVFGANKLTDVFGMTETGPVHVSNPPMRARAAAVGIPVPGADIRIVDVETGTREMPPGEAGEIISSGPQVMKGYLNLPAESARALRQWRGRTWMYTGDIGYMDEEGYVYVCDRAKDMLVVGGYKVFSVEVEDKLQALDCVASSAVIGTADAARPGNDVVNLYVELTPAAAKRDPAGVEKEILAFCRQNMAPYKVPKVLRFIEQIPLTSVGKIDKKALRARLAD